MEGYYSIIENPIEWQAEIDANGGVNMRGSSRFWTTARYHGLPLLYRNGAPDFDEIAFQVDEAHIIFLRPKKDVLYLNEHEEIFEEGEQYFCFSIYPLTEVKTDGFSYEDETEVKLPVSYLRRRLNLIEGLEPKCTQIIFKLKEDLGLCLKVKNGSCYIYFSFVALSDKN